MILLLANAKGGVGKTATATNLAVWLAQNKNVDVALVDLDTNKNSSNWGVYRRANTDVSADIGSIDVFNYSKEPDAYDKIVEKSQQYDYVLLDMGGHDSGLFRECLVIADEVIIPLRPNQGDIDVTSDILQVVEEANDVRGKAELDPLLPYVYFTQVNSNPRVPALRDAVDEFKKASGDGCNWFTIDNTASYFRQAYPTAYKQGLGVGEVKIGATKAATDVDDLAKIIFEEH